MTVPVKVLGSNPSCRAMHSVSRERRHCVPVMRTPLGHWGGHDLEIVSILRFFSHAWLAKFRRSIRSANSNCCEWRGHWKVCLSAMIDAASQSRLNECRENTSLKWRMGLAKQEYVNSCLWNLSIPSELGFYVIKSGMPKWHNCKHIDSVLWLVQVPLTPLGAGSYIAAWSIRNFDCSCSMSIQIIQWSQYTRLPPYGDTHVIQLGKQTSIVRYS